MLSPVDADIYKQLRHSIDRQTSNFKLESIYLIVAEQTKNTINTIGSHFDKLHGELQNIERNILSDVRDEAKSLFEKYEIHKAILLHSRTQVFETKNLLSSFGQNRQKNVNIKRFCENIHEYYKNIACSSDIELPMNPFKFELNEDLLGQLKHNFSVTCNGFVNVSLRNAENNPIALDNYTVKAKENSEFGLSTIAKESHKKSFLSLKKQSDISDGSNVRTQKKTSSSSRDHLDRENGILRQMTGSSEILATVLKKIRITHIENPTLFYIQRNSVHQENENFRQSCMAQANLAQSANDIKEGQVYFVKRPSDNVWYRGEVIRELKPNRYHIHFIDYGFSETVNATSLKEINNVVFLNEPRKAIACSLYGIEPVQNEWSDSARNLMEEVTTGAKLLVVFSEKTMEPKIVDVISVKNNHPLSVRDVLVITNYARTTSEQEKYIQLEKIKANLVAIDLPKFKTEKYSNGNFLNVEIKHIVSPHEFYATETNTVLIIEMLTDQLNRVYSNDIGNNKKVYAPDCGVPYAVNFEGSWYRCRIIDNSNGFLQVYFVDNGQTHYVAWDALRELDDKFIMIEEGVSMFKLSDIQPIDGNVFSSACIQKFKKLCDKSTLHMFINECTERQYEVTARIDGDQDIHVNSYLVEKGYAISTGPESIRPVIGQDAMPNILSPDVNIELAGPKNEHDMNKIKRVKVKITYAVSPSEFYVILERQLNHFNKLHENIQTAMEKREKETFYGLDWNIRDNCCVLTSIKNNIAKMWYRGVIVQINKNLYTVFLRDIGLTVTVARSSLAVISRILDDTKCAVIRCHLAYLQPTNGQEWSLAAKEKFNETTTAFQTYAISMSESQPNTGTIGVILWSLKERSISALTPVTHAWHNINTHLVYKGVVHLIENLEKSEKSSIAIENELAVDRNIKMVNEIISSHKTVECDNFLDSSDSLLSDLSTELPNYVEKWIPAKPISKHSFQGVPTFIDDNFIIYLYEEEQKQLLHKMKKCIRQKLSAPDNPTTTWMVNDTCVAKYYDDYFYRAVVKSVDNIKKECQVLFVDYGNTEFCKFVNMSKLIMFANLPIQTHKFVLDNIKPASSDGQWSEKVIAFAVNEILEKSCTIYVNQKKSTGDEPLPCSIIIEGKTDLKSLLLTQNMATATADADMKNTQMSKGDYVDDYKDLFDSEHNDSLECDGLFEGKNAHISLSFLDNSKKRDVSELNIDELESDVLSVSVSSSKTERISDPMIEIIQSVYEMFQVNETTLNLCCDVYRVINSTTLILAPVEERYEKCFDKMMENIQQEASTLPQCTFKENSECIAYSSTFRVWYRGLVLNNLPNRDNKYEILFVDYLNREFIDKNFIRYCPKKYVKIPLKIFESKLYGLKPNRRMREADIKMELRKMIETKTFWVNVKSFGVITEVELYTEKNQDLVSASLIKKRLYSLQV